MSTIDLDPTPAMPRDERKALIDIQLTGLKTFIKTPNCTDSNLRLISIELAILMAKISSDRPSQPSAVSKSFTPSSVRSSNKVMKTRQTSREKRHEWEKKLRDKEGKMVVGGANGGVASGRAVVGRREGRRRARAPRLTRDEAEALGLFSNLSLRVKEKENIPEGGMESMEKKD
ncbi:hypothetical protein ONS95_002150 [Cadophora gregata]|uniref:uncharacterized protein n=1 Tax=Cadophora gregata TaxID=51156 RepID=UPI0026DCCACF|nr:uncharacterized protein ONS95_002150 [Cadophora gregata]KAK0109457.1 hypothetical protein ONS95_002150 [Cadophora gregata]KAK0110914.1 hypothetical protein ONS96_002500 [Cadophora gregata f. sp. sojae]